ncbi:MAG: 30S ribosomal protein S2 [Candidatus Geothermincolia bacterium]
MAIVSMKHLLEAGVHFGHQTRRWHPKMKRYIFIERNGIYIIDLQKTMVMIETAYNFIRDMVANGGVVLFIGTKKQAQDAIKQHADRAGMPYVNYRWLGGMLTNWQTIRARIERLKELEELLEGENPGKMSKKEAMMLRHELEKLQRNLSGIRRMEKLPDAVFVIDSRKEHIPIMEARKLEIPVIALVDTNCDPDEVDYVIPGNDDAIRAGNLIARILADAVIEGTEMREMRQKAAMDEKAAAAQEKPIPADSAREIAEEMLAAAGEEPAEEAVAAEVPQESPSQE